MKARLSPSRLRSTNTGSLAGSQTIQVYLEAPEFSTPYPQLRALTTVALDAGEAQDITLTIPKKNLTVFNDEGGGAHSAR